MPVTPVPVYTPPAGVAFRVIADELVQSIGWAREKVITGSGLTVMLMLPVIGQPAAVVPETL